MERGWTTGRGGRCGCHLWLSLTWRSVTFNRPRSPVVPSSGAQLLRDCGCAAFLHRMTAYDGQGDDSDGGEPAASLGDPDQPLLQVTQGLTLVVTRARGPGALRVQVPGGGVLREGHLQQPGELLDRLLRRQGDEHLHPTV